MKVWYILKTMMKAGFLLSLAFLVVQAYNLYQYDKAHPLDYYKWDPTIGEEPPEDMLIKVDLYNTAVRIVWICLLFYALVELCAYFEDPKKHWVTWIITKTRGMKDD